MHIHPMELTLSLADERDREAVYAIRHQVYARVLVVPRAPRGGDVGLDVATVDRGLVRLAREGANRFHVRDRVGDVSGQHVACSLARIDLL